MESRHQKPQIQQQVLKQNNANSQRTASEYGFHQQNNGFGYNQQNQRPINKTKSPALGFNQLNNSREQISQQQKLRSYSNNQQAAEEYALQQETAFYGKNNWQQDPRSILQLKVQKGEDKQSLQIKKKKFSHVESVCVTQNSSLIQNKELNNTNSMSMLQKAREDFSKNKPSRYMSKTPTSGPNQILPQQSQDTRILQTTIDNRAEKKQDNLQSYKNQIKIAKSQERIERTNKVSPPQYQRSNIRSRKSLLTITILEAQLNEDFSTFIQKMSVYCKVALQSQTIIKNDAEKYKTQQVDKKIRISSPLKKNEKNDKATVSNPEKTQKFLIGEKQTSNQTGKNPKWSECFAFQLEVLDRRTARQSHDFECDSDDSVTQSQNFYLLELSVWSSFLLVSDKLIGKAYLKFNSSDESGSITSWVKLKDEDQKDAGNLYVCIQKETIIQKDQPQIENQGHSKGNFLEGVNNYTEKSFRGETENFQRNIAQLALETGGKLSHKKQIRDPNSALKQKRESKQDTQSQHDYQHLVQNTEECVAADGDHDDPELTGVDDDEAFEDDYSEHELDGLEIDQNNLVVNQEFFNCGKLHNQHHPSDENESDDLQENLSDLDAEDEIEPIDDVFIEQQQQQDFKARELDQIGIKRFQHQENTSSFFEEDDGPLDGQLQSISRVQKRPINNSDFQGQERQQIISNQQDFINYNANRVAAEIQHKQYLMNGSIEQQNQARDEGIAVRNVQSQLYFHRQNSNLQNNLQQQEQQQKQQVILHQVSRKTEMNQGGKKNLKILNKHANIGVEAKKDFQNQMRTQVAERTANQDVRNLKTAQISDREILSENKKKKEEVQRSRNAIPRQQLPQQSFTQLQDTSPQKRYCVEEKKIRAGLATATTSYIGAFPNMNNRSNQTFTNQNDPSRHAQRSYTHHSQNSTNSHLTGNIAQKQQRFYPKEEQYQQQIFTEQVPSQTQYLGMQQYYMTGGFHQEQQANINISNTTGSYSHPSQQSYSGTSGPVDMHHVQSYPLQAQMQYPLVSNVEDMADLQQDLIDENLRLRNEVQRIEKMFEKIEKSNRQNKQERAKIRDQKEQLKAQAKKLKAQQDEIDYKRQQIEKENIKLNKAKQKMRRMPQNIDQMLQICQNVMTSQLFERIKFEANLVTQNNFVDDEEREFSTQAQQFLMHFNNFQFLIQQIASDSQAQNTSHSSGGVSSGEISQPQFQINTPTNLNQFQAQPIIFPSPSTSMGAQSTLSINKINPNMYLPQNTVQQSQLLDSLKYLFEMNVELQKQLNQQFQMQQYPMLQMPYMTGPFISNDASFKTNQTELVERQLMLMQMLAMHNQQNIHQKNEEEYKHSNLQTSMFVRETEPESVNQQTEEQWQELNDQNRDQLSQQHINVENTQQDIHNHQEEVKGHSVQTSMSSFKVDPDFLNKMNQNILINEQINSKKQKVGNQDTNQMEDQSKSSQIYMEGILFQQYLNLNDQNEEIYQECDDQMNTLEENNGYQHQEQVKQALNNIMRTKSHQGSTITKQSQQTDQTAKFMTKGDQNANGGAAPATMSQKNKDKTPQSELQQNEDLYGEESGQGTIRHVVSMNQIQDNNKPLNTKIIKSCDSSDQVGSVPKTSDRNIIFERERSDSIVKVSSRDGQEFNFNFRPTGGSDNNRNYEQATLLNLGNVNQSHKSNKEAFSNDPKKSQVKPKADQSLASNKNSEGLDEISRLINEQYTMDHENKEINAIFKDEKLYDQPKKAIYGIQPAPNVSQF